MAEYIRKAHYHETDQMGIIHHANYVKWMEEARIAYLDGIGISYKGMETAGVVSPVTGISVEYLKPVSFDDEIGITVTVGKYTGVVLELAYTFRNLTKDEISSTAVSKHCFLSNGRITSLKRTLPEIHEMLLAQTQPEQQK